MTPKKGSEGKFELRVGQLGVELWSRRSNQADKKLRSHTYNRMGRWAKTTDGFKISLLGDDGQPVTELTFATQWGEAIGKAMLREAHKVAHGRRTKGIEALSALVVDEAARSAVQQRVESQFSNRCRRRRASAHCSAPPGTARPRLRLRCSASLSCLAAGTTKSSRPGRRSASRRS